MSSQPTSRRPATNAEPTEQAAAAGLSDLLDAVERRPTTAAYLDAARRIDQAAGGTLPQARVALLSTFTIAPLEPFLKVECARQGWAANIYVAPFDSMHQELLDPNSGCARHQPDVVFVAPLLEDVCPPLTADFLALAPDEVDAHLESIITTLLTSIDAFRKTSAARIVLHNFAVPQVPPLGSYEVMAPASLTETVLRLNRRLVERTATIPDVYVLDYNAAAASVGFKHWYDHKMWHLARTPLSAHALPALARRQAVYLRALLSPPRKCLVVDLDDTLWGGVIAESGLNGIHCGLTYPGNLYRAFQQYLLQLHRRGVLLAICSKNNEADVDEVFNRHPHMVLSREHFAARRINWRPKPENLAEIAAELNIGIDSLVFFDDNPAECALMRQMWPEVLTIQAPADPAKSVELLTESGALERLSFTAEDRQRGAMYAQQQSRQHAATAAGSLEEFLAGLAMTATIRPVDQFAFPRVIDLLRKTNQFNLTTRRYSAAQLQAMVDDPSHGVFSLQLSDRFGDNGIVGVAIVKASGAAARIDSLLLSCRVIGRTAETALLSFIADWARHRGAERLEGEYLPTAKNAPAADFLSRHGFTAMKNDSSSDLWSLPLTEHTRWQHYVRLGEAAGV
jgi:FkbH-like protein